MELSNFFGYGLASVGTVIFAMSPYGNSAKTEAPTPSEPTTIPTDNTTISPRRLTVTVRVQEPEDLKVKEHDAIKAGQVIADRERERQRLTSQKQQLQLSLQRHSLRSKSKGKSQKSKVNPHFCLLSFNF